MNRMKFNSFALGLAVCMAAVGCATAPTVPAPLQVPRGQELLLQLHATGAQIYQCQAQRDASQFEWVFKFPEATLFTKRGRNFGKHYAGPTWEANDGSRVIGDMLASQQSPTAHAIPWLLLRAKATLGRGAFSNVKYIQRLNTVLGSAPAVLCRQDQSGQQLRASYSADYFFFGIKR